MQARIILTIIGSITIVGSLLALRTTKFLGTYYCCLEPGQKFLNTKYTTINPSVTLYCTLVHNSCVTTFKVAANI